MSGAARIRLLGVAKRHGGVTALKDIDLDIAAGEFFALLGPSGSGKTTTLRILAGLESADEGRVLLDELDITDAEPGARDVAMVFQSYALYPHMSVHENIAFPLRMVSTPADEIERAVLQAAEKVRIGHLLGRRPGQLSGGQQQRCALARAIVRKPRLFLLDEPLSNLDAKLRLETRVELKKLHRSLDVTTLYVTHDQEEAMTIADRLAVFMEGRIEQVGTPEEVFAQPKSLDVAAFLGSPPMNFLPAKLVGRVARAAGQTIDLARDYGPERDAVLGIRPGAIRLEASGIPAQVYLVEQLGENAIVDLHVGETLVRVRVDRRVRVREGDTVHLAFSTEDLHVFDAATRQRL
ncbi:MAG TPA: ABC transporter ATP-binding protein [Burkholderiales bacterium]|jgi:ABC-type sugar transport system ATPase subunit|nr:ABC transporter ATP-binding protein [Burkholderiales bacterium]